MIKNSNSLLKFIFHIHTDGSLDGSIRAQGLIDYCRKNVIDVIAICDHNSIDIAKKAQALSGGYPRVIIGEEIKTKQGEIIGLFLDKNIAKGLNVLDTISEIRKQNGLVCLPHPGETLRRSAIKKDMVKKIIDQVDIIEVYNARTIFKKDIIWAKSFAEKNQKTKIYGADAHNMAELVGAVMEMNEFSDSKSFISSLKSCKLVDSNKTGLSFQLLSMLRRIIRKINIR